MTSKIYKITNLINGKIYIGYTKNTLEKRFAEHACYKYDDHSRMPIVGAIKKYGKENFKIELIEESEDDEYIHKERESFWIKELRTQDKTIGYNVADGGEGGDTLSNNPHLEEIRERMKKSSKHRIGFHHSEETKAKISRANKGKPGYKPTEEQRKKISERLKGEKNPNFRKHLSDERKQQMKDLHTNNFYWNNGIENKRSKECPGEGWVKGMLVTEESKQIRSKAHKGQKSAFKGKRHTEEAKNKLSKSHKGLFDGENNPAAKIIEIISPNGERFVVKGTIKNFCKEHNISYNMYRKYRNKGPCKCSKYVEKTNIIAKNTEGWIFNLIQ